LFFGGYFWMMRFAQFMPDSPTNVAKKCCKNVAKMLQNHPETLAESRILGLELAISLV
jgi:hypothetical protein